MYKPKAELTYALKDGHMVNVKDVSNGNACGCICPACHRPLCANNEGTKVVPYFSHVNGQECVGAYESAIHQLAKEILAEGKVLKLSNHTKLIFDVVRIEKRDDETNLRPDCIGIAGGKEYWIEFRNTHAVPSAKITKIASKKINCIEVDLRDCSLDRKTLKDFIESSVKNRIWIYSDVYAIGYCNTIKLPSEEFIYQPVAGERHCALDSHGKLIDLINPEDLKSLDLINNPCYCISCGKPLDLELGGLGGYRFVHKDEIKCCNEKRYLWLIVHFILIQRFQREGGFTFTFPCKDICKGKSDCEFYNEELCYTVNKRACELKSPEYDLTDVEVDIEGTKKNALLLSNGKNSIYFKFDDGLSDNLNGYTGVKGKHTVDFVVDDEKDALNVDTIAFDSEEESLKFHNFFFLDYELESMFDDPLATLVFVAFESHKYYTDIVHCPKEFRISRSSVLAIFFNERIKSRKRYEAKMRGLSYCYRNNIKVCLCELCFFYNSNLGVCRLYKSGFPHHPLEPMEAGSYPVDCKRFSLDKSQFYPDESLVIRRVIKCR